MNRAASDLKPPFVDDAHVLVMRIQQENTVRLAALRNANDDMHGAGMRQAPSFSTYQPLSSRTAPVAASVTVARTICWGWTISASFSRRASRTSTIASFGSIVQKG